MKEEEPPGTVVIQVHAEDRDLPENGGIVSLPRGPLNILCRAVNYAFNEMMILKIFIYVRSANPSERARIKIFSTFQHINFHNFEIKV